jgi:DNA-binding NarL/FixJ family response regulator
MREGASTTGRGGLGAAGRSGAGPVAANPGSGGRAVSGDGRFMAGKLSASGGRRLPRDGDGQGDGSYHRGVTTVAGAGRPVGLLLVDDHRMVLDGLVAMLAAHDDRARVVATTTDPAEALALAGEPPGGEPLDVALVDVRLGTASGLELCAEIVRRHPALKVVILTVYDDEQYLFEALRAGASGYLTKQLLAEDLLAHLERVVRGDIVVDPALAGRVALAAARLHRGEVWAGSRFGLSQRESEVLELMVKGHTNRAIARRLVLGEETVKTHTRSLYRKLGVSDRAQAVAFALREGIFA